MSGSILAKLQVKHTPVQQKQQEIRIRPSLKEDIPIQTVILDKRQGNTYRDSFFMDTQPQVIEETIPEETIPEEKIPEETIPEKIKKQKTKKLKLKTVIEEPSTTETPKPAEKKPKKLTKKLKIVNEEEKPQEKPEEKPQEKPEDKPQEKLIIRKRKSATKETRILPTGLVDIKGIPVEQRIHSSKETVLIKASSYYMSNREIFINFINSIFTPYKEELKKTDIASCDTITNTDNLSLMTHQKIVRDYINLYTPYRGLLLYHGLGSGKTCSSIAIAEGMKDHKKIIVMTPASLRRNYYEQLKKCGDSMYKKNQYWEFIPATDENIHTLSVTLNLSLSYIQKNNGAWFVNIKNPSNYDTLNRSEKESLDLQLDEMIRYKYQFISYNGMRRRHLNALMEGENGPHNPFDNTVVIIDEAHNLVSRIVNKLSKKIEDSVSKHLYHLLMSASNAKIILLSGTPIINYPNEIGIMFNILQGYIKTWKLSLTVQSQSKITKSTFDELFKSTVLGGNVVDYIDYNSSNTLLSITRNPFGFVNKTSKGIYEGVRLTERGDMADEDFMAHITRLLQTIQIKVRNVQIDMHKVLPDTLDEFKDLFIDRENNLINANLFKRRILGASSYFRSVQETLMPRYTKGSNFFIVDVEMSDFQFGQYEEARVNERKLELNNARKRKKGSQKNNVLDESVSTYRIFSRAFCNFVFPKPYILRPMPAPTLAGAEPMDALDEDILDSEVIVDNIDGKHEADELIESTQPVSSYDLRIKQSLDALSERKEEFLSRDALETYSPKFGVMLDNIVHPDHVGLHLVYSQFRTLEGIGVFKLVLEANGFIEFKINSTSDGWRLDVPIEERSKPMFVLYTGTESPEYKEIVRNVYNGDWKYIPPALQSDILTISKNNIYGEVIKVFMITASGAEGINLKNTRYVHITEPYWHPVRIEQVVGRARRICSHQDLPEELRTVDVFLYLMKFSEKQLSSDSTIELRLKDTSKRDGITPFTSDQALWEIANIKEELTDKLLKSVKEASIDCAIHTKIGSESLKCFSFGTVDPNKFASSGSYASEDTDAVAEQNRQTKTIQADEVIIQGIQYAIVKETGDVYEWESYMLGQPIQI